MCNQPPTGDGRIFSLLVRFYAKYSLPVVERGSPLLVHSVDERTRDASDEREPTKGLKSRMNTNKSTCSQGMGSGAGGGGDVVVGLPAWLLLVRTTPGGYAIKPRQIKSRICSIFHTSVCLYAAPHTRVQIIAHDNLYVGERRYLGGLVKLLYRISQRRRMLVHCRTKVS